MTTTRGQFAAALLPAIGARTTSDYLRLVVGWQMSEGQRPEENDPLASLNEKVGKARKYPTTMPSDNFAFASIDNALAVGVHQMGAGNVYGSIGDAFRAGLSADAVIDAIGRAGWCGGPHAPCVGYANGIRGHFDKLADPTYYAQQSAVIVGTSTISGAAGSGSIGAGGTTSPGLVTTIPPAGGGTATDVLSNPLGGVTGAFTSIEGAFKHLVDPQWWKRVGVFTLGGALVLYGLHLLGAPVPELADVTETAQGVARNVGTVASPAGVSTSPAKPGGGGKSIVDKATEAAAVAAAV